MQIDSPISLPTFLVRYGWNREVARVEALGELGPAEMPQRGDRVIVDCGRGIEVGDFLGICSIESGAITGQLVRRMLPEDELISGQLRQLSQCAFERCSAWLRESGSTQILLDVEPLLDGRTLFFHFLSAPDHFVQEHLDKLTALYEQEVSTSDFAKRVEAGCGPGCGTALAKSNCGVGCAGCSKRCSTKN